MLTVCLLLLVPAQELVVNADQTGLNYLTVSRTGRFFKGAKEVLRLANDDKRQLTAVLAGSVSGQLLPPQLIYTGTTEACLPANRTELRFKDWDFTYSANHWSNEERQEDYVNNVSKACMLEN